MPVPNDAPAPVDDAAFLDRLVDTLAALPGVRAVALGGSRAQGTHTPDSDWDTAVYYRGGEGLFEPQDLRDLGWEGEASEIGGWGGGVFNGGGWFSVEGRRVDVHYRDLDDIERVLADAEAGRFQVEPLMFHLAGIPSYLVVAELAVNQVLRGKAPKPDGYPVALREAAAAQWWGRAVMTLHYAREGFAPKSGRTEVVGAIAVAAASAAHAVLAARGEWVTNEKRLLARAGLRGVDEIVADRELGLVELVDRAQEFMAAVVADARQRGKRDKG
ncbi:nucleotidyltransferase domain-containing protein [Streptomyces sp. SID8379]|uniref:nucleotidyltransferase family protein n=1 Tax=unclassified Streptomyces TaxID=2593676 RepID=UPI00037D4242|nr:MULTISPECIES: nucleotidyltransferase domain-containing protein [unclassified Streptomyces]MYW66421.1 nucleotidyltransferase domain-containing protein [Streptomyces sp. SID8379]